jgi:Ca2+-binding RTX toxin-like protein
VTENYGANTLTLNSLTVTELSSNNTLTLAMDDADTLILSSDFSAAGTAYQYNQKFYKYISSVSAATVLVNQAELPTFTASSTNSPLPILSSNANSVASAFAVSAVSNNDSTPTTQNFVTTQSQTNAPTQLFVSNPTGAELGGSLDFIIQRTGDLTKSVLVSYITQDGDGKAGDRYNPVAGQLVFAPGETTKTVTVPIPNNGQYVGNRQFGLAVTLEGETTDPNLVPDAWQAAIAIPNEQIRRWTLIPGEAGNAVTFDITSVDSPNRIVTLDLDLDGTVIPLIWNPNTESYQNLPFSTTNGIAQFQDINGDSINDLYRLKFQDGGPFDGDQLVNGLVDLDFELAQLKPIDVPTTGGRINGTEGNDYLNAQNSTGTNRLEGLRGMDVLIGSPQRDLLLGGEGNDQLFGGAGVDQLFGEAGDDLLDGGTALDFLYGGAGADSFVLRAGEGPDRVMDFNAGAGDIFLLDNLAFGELSFNSNQILLGTNILAIALDANGQPVTNFASNPQWFTTI